jgi:hypothetical protein
VFILNSAVVVLRVIASEAKQLVYLGEANPEGVETPGLLRRYAPRNDS